MNWMQALLLIVGIIIIILLFIVIFKINKMSNEENVIKHIKEEKGNHQKYLIEEFRNTRIETNQGIKFAIDSQNQIMSNNSIENENRLEAIRMTIESRLSSIQKDNNQQLEKMRETVDEKLQKTLESRISESFKVVSERLEQVYKGLGEMQTLANGVGDLKKVLSNVKSRGILGEIQLGAILEEILIKEQYETNVITKKGSQSFVEYAIKLPGDGNPVYLPIDAKFPADAYSNLLEAYEKGDLSEIETCKNTLIKRIKSFAKDIQEKYIDPPNTTEFAIMFLPFEGLYAEVVRLGLIEDLQRLYKVNISGPTTMAALLNSLQMGFKTLAIQKRSSEVWDVLGAVKTEFAKFSTVLESAQNRIEQANSELDKLIGVRTRQIQRKLKDVEALENPDIIVNEDEAEA
ncbi:MAG: DNA recombination protein RmuC [Proteocatella sp.]